MKSYVYTNAQFMGYQITRSGCVYLPDTKGALTRITGKEEALVIQKFIAARRTEEEIKKESK